MESTPYLSFCRWLLSFSTLSSRFIHVVYLSEFPSFWGDFPSGPMVRTLHTLNPLQGTHGCSICGWGTKIPQACGAKDFSPSFQKLNNQLYMCMYTLYTRMYTYITHTLFIHYSSINELFLQKKFQEVELLDLFWDCCIQFSIVAASIYIPTNKLHDGFLSLHPCQHLLLVTFLMAAILRCVVVSLCSFKVCISLMMSDFEHLSMCLLEICMSLWKMSIQFLCLFLNWVVWFLMLSCMSALYVLDINSLSDISFAVSSFIQ